MYICPICKKPYIDCECGYEANHKEKELFNIYKYTKNVFTHKIPFQKDTLDIIEDDYFYIDYVDGKRGLALVDPTTDKKTIANMGILALNRNVHSLIINVDEIHPDFLDESIVQVLFLGPRVKHIENIKSSSLRYIFVDENNPNYISDNHVLFDKKKKRLITYASLKNEEEYYVDKHVKTIHCFAFLHPKNLKKLYLPKGIHLEPNAILEGENPIDIQYY